MNENDDESCSFLPPHLVILGLPNTDLSSTMFLRIRDVWKEVCWCVFLVITPFKK